MDRSDLTGRLGKVGVWAGFLGDLPLGQAREAAGRIEDFGYGALWIPEAMAGREVIAHASVLLAATGTLTVATGIANLWARDAIATANAGRVLFEAFEGRFVLGIGVSHDPLVKGRGHTYEDPVGVTRRYLEAVRSAEYTSPGGELPPLLLGALGPQMLGVARDLCEGVHPFLVPVAHTAMARDVLGPNPVIAPAQAFLVDDDADRARERAGRHVAGPLRLDNYRRSMLRLGFTDTDLDGPSDQLVEALVAYPSIDTVVSRVQDHLTNGADHVAIQPVVVPGEDPVRLLGELAEALLA